LPWLRHQEQVTTTFSLILDTFCSTLDFVLWKSEKFCVSLNPVFTHQKNFSLNPLEMVLPNQMTSLPPDFTFCLSMPSFSVVLIIFQIQLYWMTNSTHSIKSSRSAKKIGDREKVLHHFSYSDIVYSTLLLECITRKFLWFPFLLMVEIFILIYSIF
jgi:hypothetical protein